MHLRRARVDDIPGMHAVRLAVRENVLSDPARIQPQHYRVMLEGRGRGWVCEANGRVVAVGIADQAARNIWALFVMPEFEGRGAGRRLLRLMVKWLFSLSSDPIWLTTGRGTRAEAFYRRSGWREAGLTDGGEVRFELDARPGSVSGAVRLSG